MGENISLTFAGQAGFILQTASGYRVGIDLYLSDCCRRYFGFKRLMPFLFTPEELMLDLLIATHAHYDHFDPDSIPRILSNKKTKMLLAADCAEEVEKLGIDGTRAEYIKENEVFENRCIRVEAMPCDHGKETPLAIGLLFTVGDRRIYLAGDTCFREDYFSNPKLKNCDIMIMPINGAFGNLNEAQGAKAAGIVSPKLCIPCHYWNFAEHGGDPRLFCREMDENHADIPYLLMRPGEEILL
ncbi:MAG: MBL fold metallo-hydrolase [Clostridia bacterium]|nr:MBL fold metallo-hydrolase [Clostridia bacterium]